MDNILSYVRWYADFDFRKKPFTIVDNLVFSQLSYAYFDTSLGSARLSDCIRQNPYHFSPLVEAAKNSRRYGDVRVSFVADELSDNPEHTVQFYAVCFTYIPKKHYIAFRGTDATLAGWKEDLMMSYRLTPAQYNSFHYLEQVLQEGNWYKVGGHSKGGSLALFSTAHLSDEKLALVEHVYINDGPGLNPEYTDVSLIDRIADRITMIQPEFSIFGKIYEPQVPDIRVVKTSQSGILAHSLMTWGIASGDLAYTSRNSDTSEWINQVILEWVNNETDESRRIFVDELFETLAANGAKTRFEIRPDGLNEIKRYWNAISESDSVAKATAARLPLSVIFGNFFRTLNTGHIFKAISNSVTIQGLLVFFVGLCMILLPQRFFDISFFIIFFAIVVMQVVHTLTRLIQSKWNLKRQRPLVLISIAFLSMLMILLVKEKAMFIIESGISGFILLVWAYRNLSHARECKEDDFEFWKNIIEACFTTIFGIAILLAPGALIKWYTLSLGIFLLIDGGLTAFTGQN